MKHLISLIASLLISNSFAGSFDAKVNIPEPNNEVEITVEVYKQDNPAPTIIALHHCAGIDMYIHQWAKRYVDLGYNVVIPDSFRPRGTYNECDTGNKAIVFSRNYDLEYVARWVKTQPWHKGNIGAIGWSHGGVVISQFTENPKVVGLITAMVSYYGGCRFGNRTLIPVQFHIGDQDDWTPATDCPNFNNPKLDMNIYPNAYHSFDVFRSARIYKGHRLEYNESANNQTEQKTQNFFEKYLKKQY